MINDYSRYYAIDQGVVKAVYIIHRPDYHESVAEDCKKIAEHPFPCPIGNGRLRSIRAGQRTWVEDPIDLPGMSGGGCAQVDVEYRITDGAFMRVECNGSH